jgi:hypothetical protein
MRDSVKHVLRGTSSQPDMIDRIFVNQASKYMIQFDLAKFKVEYPSLYATIRESIKEASRLPTLVN